MDVALLRQVAEELIPFNRFLGIEVGALDVGKVTMSIPFRDELIGDPVKHALHGGVISALADVAAGVAVWSAIENPSARVSTIDLRVDYLRPGRPEKVIAESVVVRVGRTVGVADVRVYQPSAPDLLIATGKGVYAIKIPKK